MADKLHLHLFGSPQILWQDKALDGFVSNKARALLIFLAVTGRSHSRDALAELLWADTPSSRRANLKRALSNLRGLDGIVLLEEGQHLVALDSHHTWVDVVEFTQLASEATPGDMASLQRAAQLYQGEFLAGFPLSISYEFEAWVLSEQARLKEQLMALLRRLADECARRDKFPQAIATMRRLLQLEPWQEEAHRRLMELLAQNGEASAALAHFEACRRILRAELEVEPDDATLELVAQIRAGAFRSQRQHHFTALSIAPRSSEQADRAAPHNISFATGDYPNRQVLIADPFPAAADHSPSNLPLIPTPIVGREKELTDLAALLANPDCRLITLTGPGGSGKTHLAIEVAQQQVDGYPQGVYFISLAPITDVGHIVPAIAEAVQFHFQNDGRSPQAQLFAYLSRKHMLLVLDNFEHLMEGATLVHELLQSGPGIKCLVTTRERLQLNSETVFVLGSLSFPRGDSTHNVAQYGAVELFVRTARRKYPGFHLDGENWQAVIRICQLVGGMPLGVILAASWVGIIALTEIAAELAKGFQLLAVELQDIPARQRSMQVMLDYSWQRLPEAERKTFMQLSIFRGGFTRAAVQAVSDASLPVLARLINKSFVQHVRKDWYELHELLRQYGAEQLSRKPDLEKAARDRHCAYYCQLLQQQEGRLKSSNQLQALEEIEANLQNIRIAWQWAVTHGHVDRLAEAQESLNRFYDCKGMMQEGETVCHQTIAILNRGTAPNNLRLLAQLLAWQGVFNRKMGDVIRGEQFLQQSLAILDGLKFMDEDVRAEEAFLYLLMGGINREKSIQFRLQSLALYQSVGDKWGTSVALEYLGGAYQMQGDHTRADECLRESLQIREDIEDQIGIAVSLRALGLSAMDQGDYERAEKLVRRGLEIVRPSRNYFEISRILHPLGTVLLRAGKYSESISVIEECLTLYKEQNGMQDSLHIFPYLSDAILHTGQYSEASMLVTPLLTNARKIDNRFGIGHGLITLAMLSLSAADFAQAQCMAEESITIWEQHGYRLFLGQALALLGIAACKQNNFTLAQEALTKAIRMGVTQTVILPLTYALPGITLLYIEQNKREKAVEIYTSALCHPHVANSNWFEDVIGRHVANVSQRLPADVASAAQARGQKRDLWQTATEVLEQLTTT